MSGDQSIEATREAKFYEVDEKTGYVPYSVIYFFIMRTWLTGFVMGRYSVRQTAVTSDGGQNVTKTSTEKVYLSPHGRKAQTRRNCRSMAHLKEHETKAIDVCRLSRYEQEQDVEDKDRL